VREPDLDTGALVSLVARCVAGAAGTRARVVVSGRADVALAAGAHGVHLPAAAPPAARVRGLGPPGWLIGRSVHTADEAGAASAAGSVDYLVFGTVFETASKPGRMANGPADLARAVAASRVPVLAIGGVTPDRVPEVARAGAAGVAAIGLFAGPDADPVAAMTAVCRMFDTPRGLS
jgi:thiamine-phosphate pyrophosphorylase